MALQLKPEVFRWAMARSGLSEERVIKDFPKFPQWMEGTWIPTVRQLLDFARMTHVTVRDLLSDRLPDYSLQIADFRTADNRPSREPSPELYDTVRTMLDRQSWMRDYFLSESAEPVAYVGSFAGSPIDAITRDELVIAIRELLELDERWAFSQTDYSKALTYLKDRVESAGISVAINGIVGDNTHRPLDPREFRGFSLSDPFAPVIFINGKDFKSAQIFTLVHELTHLAFAQTGLSNASDEEDIRTDLGAGEGPVLVERFGYGAMESFCNEVAAKFLVPDSVLEGPWGDDGAADYKKIEQVAAKCKVNFLVVARRARDIGRISTHVYAQVCREYEDKPKLLATTGTGGGNYYNNKRYRLGRIFSDAVYTALQSDYITYRDAYDLTGLDVPKFNEYYSVVA